MKALGCILFIRSDSHMTVVGACVEGRGEQSMSSGQRKTKKRRRRGGYTKGELNYLIDDLLHPLYRENEGFRLVDAVLHGVVEQDPSQSVKKFIKYNLPAVMKKVRKQLK